MFNRLGTMEFKTIVKFDGVHVHCNWLGIPKPPAVTFYVSEANDTSGFRIGKSKTYFHRYHKLINMQGSYPKIWD